MRPGEVFRMRWEHIQWEMRSTLVPYGKTRNARRFVPMTNRVMGALAGRRKGQTDGWVFPLKPQSRRRPSDHGGEGVPRSAAQVGAQLEAGTLLWPPHLRHARAGRYRQFGSGHEGHGPRQRANCDDLPTSFARYDPAGGRGRRGESGHVTNASQAGFAAVGEDG
jgi:integrase